MTLRVFILAPTVVFEADVATNPSASNYPVDQLTFNNVTIGAFGDIEVGQMVTLGSTAQASDHGTQRIRKAATSDTIFIGRTSRGFGYGEINPIGTSNITVWNLRQVWTKPPKIDIDTSDTSVDIFKDADITHSDQTSQPPPVANTGAGIMATIDGSNIITVEFPAGGADLSFAVADGATISTYLWDVGDGTITVGTSASAVITATFPAGFRYVSLTITDSNGKTHTAYCPVFARDPASDDTISGIDNISIRATQDGREASIRLMASLAESTYPDNTLVMIADGEPASATDRSHMEFIGWHHRDSADHGAERSGFITGSVLTCLDVAGKMQNIHAFPQEIINDATPATWGEMSTLNLDKYMHYLLQWHSNVLDLADWQWSGQGATYALHIRGSDAGTLWDQVKEQAEFMLPIYRLTCNRVGQLDVLPDPVLQASGDRTSTVQTSLDESEWQDWRYDHERYPRYFYLWGGAIIASNDLNADGFENTVFCIAPGQAAGIGYTEYQRYIYVTPDQGTLNTTFGHLYARFNAPERPMRFTLATSDDFGIDPADMTWVQITGGFNSATAPRGLQLNAERGLPLELGIRYSSTRSGIVRQVELLWERETVGTDAVSYFPPQDANMPEEGDWWGGDYFDDNAGLITSPVSPPPLIPSGAQEFAFFSAAGNLYRTSDLQTDSGSGGPTWTETVLGLGASDIPIFDFVVDPFSPGYLGTGTDINGYFVTESSIYKIEDIFGTPSLTLLHTFSNGSAAAGQWRTIDASFGRFFSEQSDNPWIIVVSYYHDEAGHEGTWSIYSQDAGQTWSTETQISQHYTTQTAASTYEEISVWASPRVPGRALTMAYTSTADIGNVAMYETLDWGANWSLLSPSVTSANRLSPAIHVPWHDNVDEAIMFWSYINRAAPNDHRLYRRDSSDPNLDISFLEEYAPDEFRSYGLCRKWGIRSSDIDRRSLIYAGRGNDTLASTTGDNFILATSNNGGDSWTILELFGTATRSARMAAFIANSDVEYIALGRNMYVGYSAVGGAPDDRSGNLQTLEGGNVFVRGFCGGLS